MIDLRKRNTLKVISGAGAATLCSFTALAATTVPATTDNSHLNSPVENSKSGTFNIQIINGITASEDTIIFTNQSGADIHIKEFLPGLVTQNEEMINLNSLLADGDLILKHGYPLATKAASWQPLSLGPKHSYLWCDNAVTRFSNSDAGVITVNAVINNGRALLTTQHENTLLS